MDAHVKNIVKETTKASNEERIVFPDVVKALMAAGVERYHVDLIDGSRTFYMPDDSYEVVPCEKSSAPAKEFSAQAVEQAIRTSQRGEIGYREFCRRIADAGCVGYIVSMAGRRALYYGRTDDSHVEYFPGAK
jgi:uncharacterized protein YbcV (DUF1398 family)